jgi:hypothetical protein
MDWPKQNYYEYSGVLFLGNGIRIGIVIIIELAMQLMAIFPLQMVNSDADTDSKAL